MATSPCVHCGALGAKCNFACPICPPPSNRFGVCNRSCQKAFWKVHKSFSHQPPPELNPFASFSSGPLFTVSDVATSQELTESWENKQSWYKAHGNYRSAEWIVDCYRMRAYDDVALGSMNDDVVAWDSMNYHGIYEIYLLESEGVPWMFGSERTSLNSHRKASIVVKDFLKFFKLGIQNEVIPPSKFNFALCVSHFAPNLIVHPFEKEDAKVKWGGENLFSVRPSLRRTAEAIYGLSFMSSYEDDEAQAKGERVQREICEVLKQGLDASNFEASEESLFQDVGGRDLWTGLFRALKRHYDLHG